MKPITPKFIETWGVLVLICAGMMIGCYIAYAEFAANKRKEQAQEEEQIKICRQHCAKTNAVVASCLRTNQFVTISCAINPVVTIVDTSEK